jgi:sec-independent protein translocase protein TatB
MFDIAFSEVLIIFVLALVVLGPEKLPRVAAQVGRWIGRARGMARQFREQLEEEVNLEEARKAQPPTTRTPPPPPVPSLPAVPAEPAAPVAAAPASTPPPQAEPEQKIGYPDHYSHAHPTDSLGRPVPLPTDEPAAVESGQHDWVGGVTGTEKTATEKPAQPAADAAYAPSHERGT